MTFTSVSSVTFTGMIEPSVVSKSFGVDSLNTVASPENTGTETVLPTPCSSAEKSVEKYLANARPRCASMIAWFEARMSPGLVSEPVA